MSSEEATSSRETVISAANLLLVAGMKLNRALVPILLRWLRGRRTNWIRRASADVYRDLREDPEKRFLCFGECCAATYEMDYPFNAHRQHENDHEFDDNESEDDGDEDMENEQNTAKARKFASSSSKGNSVVASSQSEHSGKDDSSSDTNPPVDTTKVHPQSKQHEAHAHKHALHSTPHPRDVHIPVEPEPVLKENNVNIQTQLPVHPGTQSPIGPLPHDNLVPSIAIPFVERSLGLYGTPVGVQGMSVQERYVRLLVAQEEIHRMMKVKPLVYMSVLFAWVTLTALFVYSTIIIVVVVVFFPMSSEQLITFSFSLIATATVSEADQLLKVVRNKVNKGKGNEEVKSKS